MQFGCIMAFWGWSLIFISTEAGRTSYRQFSYFCSLDPRITVLCYGVTPYIAGPFSKYTRRELCYSYLQIDISASMEHVFKDIMIVINGVGSSSRSIGTINSIVTTRHDTEMQADQKTTDGRRLQIRWRWIICLPKIRVKLPEVRTQCSFASELSKFTWMAPDCHSSYSCFLRAQKGRRGK